MEETSPNAWAHLLTITKPRAKGTFSALQIRSWGAVRAADATLKQAMATGDIDLVIKALHCATQVYGGYLKTIRDLEFDERLTALEQAASHNEKEMSHGR